MRLHSSSHVIGRKIITRDRRLPRGIWKGVRWEGTLAGVGEGMLGGLREEGLHLEGLQGGVVLIRVWCRGEGGRQGRVAAGTGEALWRDERRDVTLKANYDSRFASREASIVIDFEYSIGVL